MAAPVANEKKAAALLDEVHSRKAFGWAARDSSGILSPFLFSRRENGANDVTIKIMNCGICHSDLHNIKNEWKNSIFPVVPGHEIVGEIIQVGSGVSKFKVGDKAGVGCLVGSCRSCASCELDCENYCPGVVYTYNSLDADGSTPTFGGYSDAIVVDQHFAVRFPEGVALDRAAPMLCAGITVYSPMKRFGQDQPGMHLGVVGFGGLGHMAVKFARAFGMKVTVISTSPSKKEEAIERLGADAFLLSRDPEQMKAAAGTLDGIINTVSAVHDIAPLVDLLKYHGKMILVGAPTEALQLHVFPLLLGGKVIARSAIGGMKETEEMIDFAAKHNVGAEIELININYVNEAMKRLVKASMAEWLKHQLIIGKFVELYY